MPSALACSPSPLSHPPRSLGVHCSKVRSLTLDSWEPELLKVSEGCPDDVGVSGLWGWEWMGGVLWGSGLRPVLCRSQLMCELGNSMVNQIYEAQCEGLGSRKPTASSPR